MLRTRSLATRCAQELAHSTSVVRVVRGGGGSGAVVRTIADNSGSRYVRAAVLAGTHVADPDSMQRGLKNAGFAEREAALHIPQGVGGNDKKEEQRDVS